MRKILEIIHDLTPSVSHYGAEAYSIPRDKFNAAAKALRNEGVRLVAEWASDDTAFGSGFSVYAAYSDGTGYLVIRSEIPFDDPVFPSLTKKFIAARKFERRIHSLMGLTPLGHPDLRPWIKHEDWPPDEYPLRKSFDGKKPLLRVEGSYGWARAEGEGVFEIAVGPVHAGIIEPGHFRFQSVGEDIINLETRFGYVHKGIEKRFEELPWFEAAKLAGRVSGDSTAAHALAYSRAVEAASGCVVPERAHWIRALMVEIERIANHLNDIGAISNDTAFSFLLYQFMILREKVLRMSREVFGHRLMMDRIIPGGVAVDLDGLSVSSVLDCMDKVSVELERLVRIYEENPSVEDRVYGTGILTPEAASQIGAVGFVARSSGVRLDCRVDTPFPPYDQVIPKVTVLSSGDVHARTWVRIEEARESMRLVREILRGMPDGPVSCPCDAPKAGTTGFSAVEGWRGEIIYWVQAGPGGGINRCMVRDPSSVNWLSIEIAVKDNIVPDFPLCNKSFNQSYSGNDL